MRPIARKHRRFVAILLSPLLAIAFLAGFALNAVGERKGQTIKLKTRPHSDKPTGDVNMEVIFKEEEFIVQ
jgi:hypothetical protein